MKVKSSIEKYCWRGFTKTATPKENFLLHTDFHGPWVIAFTGCSGDYCWSAIVLVLCAYCFKLSVIKSSDDRTLTQLHQIRYCYKNYHHQRLLAFNFIPFNSEIFVINLIRRKIIVRSWVSLNSNQQIYIVVVCAFADLIYALKSEVIRSMRCSIKMYSNLKSPCQFS